MLKTYDIKCVVDAVETTSQRHIECKVPGVGDPILCWVENILKLCLNEILKTFGPAI